MKEEESKIHKRMPMQMMAKKEGMPMDGRKPKLAIIESNTLAVMGLKQLLETAMPFAEIESFGTFGEFETRNPNLFMHFFVSMQILLPHRTFFLAHKHKTIALTLSNDPNTQMSDFHCLCVNVSEAMLIKELFTLQKMGHPHGEHLPQLENNSKDKLLSDRETEVLSLIAQGLTNKEIGEKLFIGLTTVITHRKNIQEKLGLKSVPALTIYAVTHGFVDINHI